MGTRDPRIDAYITNAAEFAQPILMHVRETVHAACPDIDETMKWSFPHFMHHGIVCSMAAFKAHCALGFWKGALVLDGPGDAEAMGQFGRITSLKDLPGKRVLTGYIKKAAQLNRDGIRVPKSAKASPTATARAVGRAKFDAVPADLAAALDAHRTALDTFDAFSPSHRREYVEWIVEAKRDETRRKRIADTIAMLSEGKTRNWKYERA